MVYLSIYINDSNDIMGTIFITGVTGLLGQHFANHYAEAGFSVKGIARNIENPPSSCVHPNITLIEGDILDITFLAENINAEDIVIHCAAMVSFNPKDKNRLFKINHEGTENIVNVSLAQKAKKLLFISSVAALGKPANTLNTKDKVVINENQMWLDGPENSNYAKSKFLAETEVWRGQAEGLPVLIVNPSVILGEDNWNNSSSRLFKYVWDKNKFQTNGYLNYVDVQDVVRVSSILLDKETSLNQRYILNAGRIKLEDFFKQVEGLFGRQTKRITLSSFWINILWRIEYLRSQIIGSDPLITKETSISTRINILFDNTKGKNAASINYSPLEKSLKRISSYYLNAANAKE